ncbi:hypothetical protein, partial [Brevundimonas sp.]|uniref:hypothetical protein n=1 Tax=Brevundimonas sp. TaxID=1871086 RepID=UPI0028A77F2E
RGEGSMTAPLYVELVERGAAQHADRIAMVVGEVEQTFAEVNARANRYGRHAGSGHHAGGAGGPADQQRGRQHALRLRLCEGWSEPGADECAVVARRA